MPPRRASSRLAHPLLLWGLVLVFCLAESAILFLAFQRNLDHRQLSTQLSLTQQGSAVAWSLSHSAAHADREPVTEGQQEWLDSLLRGLLSGGVVNSLENIRTQVAPVEDPEARRILIEMNTHLATLGAVPAAGGVTGFGAELAAIAPTLNQLAARLTHRHDDAQRQADLLAISAIATGLLGFMLVGTLLLLQRRHSERSGRLLRSMLNQIGAGVCILGSTDKIADANRAACRMLGRPRKALRGRRLSEILTEREGVWTGERPDGLPLAVEQIPGVIDGYKGPLRIVTLLDITARHLTNECLQHLANHDSLTGLPNRGFLAQHFRQELARCEEERSQLGVAVLDLDGFKPINDTYGHAIGDALLVQISQRLGAALRNGDVIARIGGDEFAGVFPNITNRDTLNFLGERLLGIFDHPFRIQDKLITIGGSIGLALAPADGTDQDSLLKAADAAMYRAKNDGRPALRLASRSDDSLAA